VMASLLLPVLTLIKNGPVIVIDLAYTFNHFSLICRLND
jgi:hypothetical protein